MTIGNVTTVRWLNTAVTLCRIYLSVHGLNARDTKNLNLIIVFIVAYYFPMYFYIKVSIKGSIQKCNKFDNLNNKKTALTLNLTIYFFLT